MGFFSTRMKYTPRTHAACAKIWADHPVSVKRSGSVALGANTRLCKDEGKGTYYATIHGHTIVEYFPEYKVIDAQGWEGAPTTQGKIGMLTGAHMCSNAALGYVQKVRVNGYPYFKGMRVDNYGNVLEECKQTDFKERNVKAVVNQYTALFRSIEKAVKARYELGEWTGLIPLSANRQEGALFEAERLLGTGEKFLPHDLVADLLAPKPEGVPPLRELLKRTKEFFRGTYYAKNNGYETIEVKKESHNEQS